MIGQQIESESFRIIRSELGEHTFNDDELAVVVRVIHATADFDFKAIMRFHPQAVASGVQALRSGCSIITDVRMAEVGISARLLNALGGQTRCVIGEPKIYALAEREGITRSAASMRYLAPQFEGSIIAIGNAPTALLEVMRLICDEDVRPALVIGVPVGFVSAVESKDELLALDVPYITAIGRKGGSTVVVALVNALLRLALEQPDGNE